MWFLLALVAGLLFAINKLIFRAVFVKEVNPVSFLAIHDGLAGLLLLPLALLSFTLPQSPKVWAALVLGILFIFIANYFAALSLKNTEASIYQIVGQSRHVVVLFGAAILFSEPILPIKIISVLLIIAGVVVAIKQNTKIKLTKGIVYALISGVAIGLAFLFIKLAAEDVRPVVSASMALIISGFLSYLVTVVMKHKDTKIAVEHRSQLLIASIIFAVFELTLFTALDIGEASRVTPVTQSSMIFTIVGAYIFLNERKHLTQKVVGASLIVLGIAILYFL